MTNSVEKKQKRIYTDGEMVTIRNNFKDNEALCKSIRKVMLQMPLNELDEKIANGIKSNKELVAVIRKAFLPTLDPDAPNAQLIDLWMTVRIEEKTPEEALPHLVARQLLIEYLDNQLGVLEGKQDKELKFTDLTPDFKKPADVIYSSLATRNSLIQHTEMQIQVLTILANQEEETAEEALARLNKDSNR